MDILLASHGYPPTHSAGAERRTERMAKWLHAQGYRVVVFTVERVNDSNQRIETQEQDGVLVHRLYYDIESGDAFQNIYDNAFVGRSLRNILETQHFDLVHIVSGYLLGAPAIQIVKQLGLPLVITLTEYWFMCTRLNLMQITGTLCSGPESVDKCTRCILENKRRYRLPAQSTPAIMNVFWPMSHRLGLNAYTQNAVSVRQRRLKEALESADLVICPSQFLIDKFKEFSFNTDRFVHIRQGLAARTVQPQTPRASAQNGTLRLAYIGQIKHHKGVDLLVDAVTRLTQAGNNVRLDVWGNLSEEPDYVNQLKVRSQRNPAIHWNGHFTGGKIWDVLSEVDAVVVPSRWYENSPNVILESFAMGVPIVTTNLGGMAELVTHEHNGLLFQLDRADDLYNNLSRLARDATLLPRLRQGIPEIKTLDHEMHEITAQYSSLVRVSS